MLKTQGAKEIADAMLNGALKLIDKKDSQRIWRNALRIPASMLDAEQDCYIQFSVQWGRDA